MIIEDLSKKSKKVEFFVNLCDGDVFDLEGLVYVKTPSVREIDGDGVNTFSFYTGFSFTHDCQQVIKLYSKLIVDDKPIEE